MRPERFLGGLVDGEGNDGLTILVKAVFPSVGSNPTSLTFKKEMIMGPITAMLNMTDKDWEEYRAYKKTPEGKARQKYWDDFILDFYRNELNIRKEEENGNETETPTPVQ